MVLLSPSPSPGNRPAAGDRAHHLPEPVHAVLGQSHHQLHDLCWWGWCHLLPGKEQAPAAQGGCRICGVLLSSHCITGRVEEQGTWSLALTEPDI